MRLPFVVLQGFLELLDCIVDGFDGFLAVSTEVMRRGFQLATRAALGWQRECADAVPPIL
jgi:hypothetical protein